jgi:hypothetical protein
MADAMVSLAVLMVLAAMIVTFEAAMAKFEIKAVQQTMAVMAAESQCERICAGLAVLDAQTFASRYPGLKMTFREESRSEGPDRQSVGVVCVTSMNPAVAVKVELAVARRTEATK